MHRAENVPHRSDGLHVVQEIPALGTEQPACCPPLCSEEDPSMPADMCAIAVDKAQCITPILSRSFHACKYMCCYCSPTGILHCTSIAQIDATPAHVGHKNVCLCSMHHAARRRCHAKMQPGTASWQLCLITGILSTFSLVAKSPRVEGNPGASGFRSWMNLSL